VLRDKVRGGQTAAAAEDRPCQQLEDRDAALSELWTRSDQEGVRLANDLVAKCAALLRIGVTTQPAQTRQERVQKWATGYRWTPERLDDYEHAVEDLAQSRKRLADYARVKLGQESVEFPFAQARLEAARSAGH
jgi:hypothetical protein